MSASGRPIDLDHLDRYTGGDRALNAEILALFDGQCRDMMARLEALASGPGDTKAWRDIAHTLKGAARGIGAFALGDAAAEAEQQATSDGPAALAALERLKRESAETAAFIAKILEDRH